MKHRDLHIVVYQEDDQYVTQCLDIDIASCGNTKSEALKNIQEAIDLYFEDAPKQTMPRIHRASIVTQKLSYA